MVIHPYIVKIHASRASEDFVDSVPNGAASGWRERGIPARSCWWLTDEENLIPVAWWG